MRFKIFSAILLIAIVGEVNCGASYIHSSVIKCLERLNIIVSSDYMQHLDIDNLSKTEKMVLTCAAGCGCKEQGLRKGKTMYQVLLDALNKGHLGTNNVETMKQKLETCADVEGECKFMECLDIFNPPWKEAIYKQLQRMKGNVPLN